MGDIDLCKTFSEISVANNRETNIVKYFCNYAFSEVLDPNKNIKFPGTMVDTVSRKDLDKMSGEHMIHVPYKSIEIVSWVNPVVRQFPYIDFDTIKSSKKKKSRVKNIVFDTSSIDFGEKDTFDYMKPVYIDYKRVCFGGKNEKFFIYAK
jgi:hypothetical protein